jgi:DNA-binding transcriptional MerR regulator
MSIVQGTIFGDSIPELGSDVGYKTPTVAYATGLTVRQINTWVSKGICSPSLKDSDGSGDCRLYTFKDIVILKTFKQLRDIGISVQKLSQVAETLRNSGFVDLSQVTLFSDSRTVYLAKSPNEVVDLLKSVDNFAQGAFMISLSSIWAQTEGVLHEIKPTTVKEEVLPPVLRALYEQRQIIRKLKV